MYFAPYLAKFVKHLPEDGNAELSLLKAHLLIEEILSLAIERNMKRPDFLRKSQLSFEQKRVLAQGFLSGASDCEWVWEAIEKLNRARNKLAHHLDNEVLEKKMEAFMQYVDNVEGPPPDDAFNGPIQRFQLSAVKVFLHTLHIVEIDPSAVKIQIMLGDRKA